LTTSCPIAHDREFATLGELTAVKDVGDIELPLGSGLDQLTSPDLSLP